MNKNLNIAYLNGAEGMIRRGGASSGGSGSGSGSEIKWEYYSIDWDKVDDKGFAEEVVLCAHSVNYSAIYTNATEKCIASPTMLMNSAGSIHPILSPDGLKIALKKISGNNIPIQITFELEGETNSLTADNGSWIENIKMYCGVDDIPFLIPITKEEFYSLE